MKTNFSKALLPALVVGLSIAGALGSHAMTVKAKAFANKPGWFHTGNPQQPCGDAQIMCSDVFSPNICETTAGVDLYDLTNPVSCPNPLYKRVLP